MKVLFDTNVILDVLQARTPHVILSAALVDKVATGKMAGLLCATTLTTIAYLLERSMVQQQGRSGRQARADARVAVKALLQIFEIAPVTRTVIDNAANGLFDDFEDAVLHESAIAAGANGILTRNPDDYGKASIRIYTPQELVAVIRSTP